MIADDWKILMKALAIKAQAIHFSKGTTQREQDAIADHMIVVAGFIERDPVPTFIKAISDSQEECLARLKAANLQVERLEKLDIPDLKIERDGARRERDAALLQIRDLKEAVEAALGFLQFDQPNGKGDVGGLISKLVNASNAVAEKRKCGCPADGYAHLTMCAERTKDV